MDEDEEELSAHLLNSGLLPTYKIPAILGMGGPSHPGRRPVAALEILAVWTAIYFMSHKKTKPASPSTIPSPLPSTTNPSTAKHRPRTGNATRMSRRRPPSQQHHRSTPASANLLLFVFKYRSIQFYRDADRS